MRRFFNFALIMTILCGVSACDGKERGAGHKETVKIGAILPLTGGVSEMAEAGKNGIILAVDEINKNPNNMYHYELIVEDGALDPKRAKAIYSKLMNNDDIKALITFDSAFGLILKPLTNRDKILHISGAIEKNIIDNQYNYINSFDVREVADTLADYLKKMQYKTLSLATVNHASTPNFLNNLKDSFKDKKLEIISEFSFNPEQRDFKIEALKIAKQNPDAVFVYLFEPALSIFTKDLRQVGYNGKISNYFMMAYSPNKDLFEGQLYVDMSSGDADFVNKYHQKFRREPLSSSPCLYDSAMMIFKFIEQNGVPDTVDEKAINKLFQDTVRHYDGSQGKLFYENGLIYPNSLVKTIKDGKPVTAE